MLANACTIIMCNVAANGSGYTQLARKKNMVVYTEHTCDTPKWTMYAS